MSLLLVRPLCHASVSHNPHSSGTQFVPETYVPVLLKRKAAKLRKETGDDKYWAPLDRHDKSLTESLLMSIYTPFSESCQSVCPNACSHLCRADTVRPDGAVAEPLVRPQIFDLTLLSLTRDYA